MNVSKLNHIKFWNSIIVYAFHNDKILCNCLRGQTKKQKKGNDNFLHKHTTLDKRTTKNANQHNKHRLEQSEENNLAIYYKSWLKASTEERKKEHKAHEN